MMQASARSSCCCYAVSLARPLRTLKPSPSHALSGKPLIGSRWCQYGASRQQRTAIQALLPEQGLVEVASKAASSLPSQMDQLASHLTVAAYNLAEAAAATDPTLSDTVSSNKGGWFGWLAAIFEKALRVLDAGLSGAGVPYAYGFAIILLTIMVKLATFPLSKQQVESTMAMQQLQPRIKALQEQYKGRDQQEMQIKVAELYKQAGVNPLAGCLPTLATLPVWIGLYRALSNVADEGLLTEGWFWIPSLAGPTSLASRNAGGGFSWLLPFKDGAPPIGWHDALCYLVLPAALVASQFITQRIMNPPQSEDQAQQQSNAILKFLPFMIGWFSLNVPSGLTLYWFTNNLLTTGQQVWLKQNTKSPELPQQQQAGTAVKNRPSVEDLAPKPSGQQMSARRSDKKGAKFAELKAQEAARRAAKTAGSAVAQAAGSEPSSAGEAVDSAAGQIAETARGASVKTQEREGERSQVPDAPPSKGKNKSSENGAPTKDRKH